VLSEGPLPTPPNPPKHTFTHPFTIRSGPSSHLLLPASPTSPRPTAALLLLLFSVGAALDAAIYLLAQWD
jgi:hypothetical protein